VGMARARKTKMTRTRGKSKYRQFCVSLNSPYSEDDSEEEEDDTAELLRELEKIKRERAEEKARLVRALNVSFTTCGILIHS
jgi:type I restriction-modification system DNA methylase subunit